MLAEGMLGLLAVLAATAGFASGEEWWNHYSSWGAADGLSAKLDAFVSGGATFVASLGIEREMARTFMAVMVIAFAATSLDTGARIQRLVISELASAYGIRSLENRYLAGALGIGAALLRVDAHDTASFHEESRRPAAKAGDRAPFARQRCEGFDRGHRIDGRASWFVRGDGAVADGDGRRQAAYSCRIEKPDVDTDAPHHGDVALGECESVAIVRTDDREDSRLLEADPPARATLEARVDRERVARHPGNLAL
jgi:hypothetical protein